MLHRFFKEYRDPLGRLLGYITPGLSPECCEVRDAGGRLVEYIDSSGAIRDVGGEMKGYLVVVGQSIEIRTVGGMLDSYIEIETGVWRTAGGTMKGYFVKREGLW